ncbi:glycosyltransferase [Thalassotalea ponticola]|uniref:glycosyltransferase n=1 Tax=Thalassotalea ponticola TaxID=1523392 RepID=UPI0025B57C57|nr:glycosyltransferase [Thalassotalea ponticola]MDN3652658.1 glycosyltransferase [Thalassotalea ponticola]
MKLTIVVPVYNVEDYLARCLVSISEQGLNNSEYEVICVNDGSTDNSKDIALEHSNLFVNFRLICIENAGLSNARNIGLQHSRGEYVYFIDSDDFLAIGALNLLLTEAIEKKLDFLGFDMLRTSGNSIPKVNSLRSMSPIVHGLKFIAENNYNNGACAYLVRKKVLTENDIYFARGKMCEDGPFTTETLSKCERVSYTPTAIYAYYQNPNSITTSHNPQHLCRLQDGFLYAIDYFNQKVSELEKLGELATARRLMNRRDSYVFFYLSRLTKFDLKFNEVKAMVNDLDKKGVYPIYCFPNSDYPGLKYKVATLLFSHPVTLFMLIKIFAINNKRKIRSNVE